MKEEIEQRLQKLKTEFESGQRMMSQLEIRQSDLNGTLLRISGAIQVLEELLNQSPEEEHLRENPAKVNMQKIPSA